MNMKKPEMKIMRFVNEDVIATSGATPAAFELRGFYDGKPDNLETYVDGIKYNGGNALKDALDNKYRGNYKSLRLIYDSPFPANLSISRLNQGDSGYDSNSMNSGVVNANGKYTYSGIDSIDSGIIIFTKSTQ